MAIFTDAQKSALLALIGGAPYTGQSPAAIVALLNAASTVANPVPQGTVSVPFDLAQIITACSVLSRTGLASFITVATPLIIAQDQENIAKGLDGLVLLGMITEADATAIKAVMTVTQPDPAWPATVPGPTPFQSLFPGIPFRDTDGSIHEGNCTLSMISEVLS